MTGDADQVRSWKDVEARADEAGEHPAGEVRTVAVRRTALRVGALSGLTLAAIVAGADPVMVTNTVSSVV